VSSNRNRKEALPVACRMKGHVCEDSWVGGILFVMIQCRIRFLCGHEFSVEGTSQNDMICWRFAVFSFLLHCLSVNCSTRSINSNGIRRAQWTCNRRSEADSSTGTCLHLWHIIIAMPFEAQYYPDIDSTSAMRSHDRLQSILAR
jgi:hypothetical protein